MPQPGSAPAGRAIGIVLFGPTWVSVAAHTSTGIAGITSWLTVIWSLALPLSATAFTCQRKAATLPGAVRFHATGAAPQDLRWVHIDRAELLATDDDNIYCGARLNKSEIVIIGRRGGPEFLDSEIARLGHLVGLAMSISRAAKHAAQH